MTDPHLPSLTSAHAPAEREPARPTLRTITTPWTPYALVFSRDGGRLVIGGGSYNGRGGIMVVDHASGHSRVFSHDDLPELGGGSVSGLCFSADARHLVASAWGPRQHGGRVVVFEVDGLEVRPAHTIELDYSGGARFIALASGVALHDGMALVRNHRGAVEDLILKLPLPDAVHRGPVQPFGSQRLVVVDDRVVTGNHGELEVIDDPGQHLGLRQYGEGRIVIAPIGHPGSPDVVDVEGSSSITALARVGDRLITGGRRGELDAWSLDGRWQRQRIREATRREPPSIGDLGLTSTYLVDSIVDVCAIPHGGAASVSIGGELCLFDAATRFVSHGAPGPGSPRSLAAHPDGGALAVGIKQRGIHAPRSIVAIVDLRPPIEDAWRTPAVRSLAQAASARDAEAFVVLADALETAGASAPILHHLRHHDHALTSCWVVDALVAA